ncbi:MAG TPA: metallophosphoesterase [Candidatus Angelobacter sp.]
MTSPQTSPKPPAGKFQDPPDLMGLARSPLLSHFRQKADDLKDDGKKFPRLQAFLPQNLWPWISNYLKFAFRRKHRFPSYPGTGEQGLYQLKAADGGRVFKLSIVGDWGTGTREANDVALGMQSFDPDYTIHLGDVYYVGDKNEINENCLGQPAGGYNGVTWPKGKLGSFAMNGNHEMYANGNAYFDNFLPTLGIPSSQDHAQLASFFCLENDTWRILGLDTGYNSTGLPILGGIPLLSKIPGIGADCKLEKTLLEWLKSTVKVQEKPKPTIVLTHHQYYSAFEGGYKKPAKQLADLFGNQELIWIWGHEHRLAIYDKFSDSAMPAYGRCVGNGGMPIELKAPRSDNAGRALQYYDAREYAQYDGVKVGFNGFVNLKLAGTIAEFDYRDVTNKSLLVEQFIATGGGAISQLFLFASPDLSKGKAAPQGVPAQPAGVNG